MSIGRMRFVPLAVTFASGITAPEESLTTPCMLPVFSCRAASAENAEPGPNTRVKSIIKLTANRARPFLIDLIIWFLLIDNEYSRQIQKSYGFTDDKLTHPL